MFLPMPISTSALAELPWMLILERQRGAHCTEHTRISSDGLIHFSSFDPNNPESTGMESQEMLTNTQLAQLHQLLTDFFRQPQPAALPPGMPCEYHLGVEFKIAEAAYHLIIPVKFLQQIPGLSALLHFIQSSAHNDPFTPSNLSAECP